MSNLIRRLQDSLSSKPVDYQEVRLKPTPVWSKAVVWTIIGSASFGFIFAIFTKIDEVVVATGTLQGIGASRPVMSPAAGVVSKIFVNEGQYVKAGQSLLKFDPDVNQTRQDTVEEKLKLERQRFQQQQQCVRFSKELREYQANRKSLRTS